ncbi:MAG: YciI family protein [Pseudomonadota bacterium]
MLYAILAYHEEEVVQGWSEPEDDTLMEGLIRVHDGLVDAGRLGPAARLGATALAATIRGGVVTDGPFAETKEHLLGLYVTDAPDMNGAIRTALELQAANPGAVYEVRPIVLYIPGAVFPLTDQGLALVRPGA